MENDNIKLLATILVICAIIPFIGCTGSDKGRVSATPVRHSGYSLPISERDFYIGVVPTPRSVPAATFEDMASAYKEAGDISEVSMVWVSPQGIGQYERLKQNQAIAALRAYGIKPVVTLNFATVKQVPGEGLKYVVDAPEGVNASLSDPEFRRRWVEEAGNIARDFKPEYFSLGNEVNDYFYLHPEDLDAYVTLYDEAYRAIKEASPSTKVFVVFSYEHMLDNGQLSLLKTFSPRADLIGLTTYPWDRYETPEGIPADYYSRLNGYTDRPLAFTEIGWISSSARGGSEKEQAEFLVRFLELTRGNRLEMVNWLFLHEAALSGEPIYKPETGTISLKRPDGSKKEIYDLWLDLKELKKV